MSEIKIIGKPTDAKYDYEFEVLEPTENENEYKWIDGCPYWDWAEQIVQRGTNRIIAHNVRICHQKERVVKGED